MIRYWDPVNSAYVYSFSQINLDASTYPTLKELNQRASSLAFNHYKLEKRELAKHIAKKKLMWIMAVVKCKSFVNKLKKKWQTTKREKYMAENDHDNDYDLDFGNKSRILRAESI